MQSVSFPSDTLAQFHHLPRQFLVGSLVCRQLRIAFLPEHAFLVVEVDLGVPNQFIQDLARRFFALTGRHGGMQVVNQLNQTLVLRVDLRNPDTIFRLPGENQVRG